MDSTPFPYVVGRTLDLKTTRGENIQVTITRAHPVSMSPAMEVQMAVGNGCRKAFLKFFDRRFGGDRRKQPHNQQAEAVWLDSLRSGFAQSYLDDLQEADDRVRKARFEEEDDDDSEDESEESEESEDDDEYKQQQIHEATIYYHAQESYKNEVRAYGQLASLQGKCIPRFIDTVIDDSVPAPADLPATYFQVPGILIEYIPGFTLRDLHLAIPDSPNIWQGIVEEAIEMVKQVNAAGLVHDDCQLRNVIISETSRGKFQSYLIDFAQCSFRDDFTDTDNDEDMRGWKFRVHCTDNHGAIMCLSTMRIKREASYRLKFQIEW